MKYDYGIVVDKEKDLMVTYGTRGIWCPTCRKGSIFEEDVTPAVAALTHLAQLHDSLSTNLDVREGEKYHVKIVR